MNDDPRVATMQDLAAGPALHSEVLEARSASERLTQSRERMRRALRGEDEPGTTGTPRSAGDRLSQQFPLLAVAGIVGRESLQGVADRHPWSLVAGAALAGGLLAWVQPWRWLMRPAVLAGLATRAISLVPADVAVEMLIAQLAAKAPVTPERSHAKPD